MLKTTILNTSAILFVCFLFSYGPSQTANTFNDLSDEEKLLVTPKRLSIDQSVSFGMATTLFSGSNLRSQGLYTTMLTYKLTNPVTLKFNFGLPIYSNFNDMANPTPSNLKSLDYFKNIPLSASITWKPNERTLMNMTFIRETPNYYFQPQFFDNTFFRGFREPLYTNFRRQNKVKQ